jgi:hypothetical protein
MAIGGRGPLYTIRLLLLLLHVWCCRGVCFIT